MLPWCDDDGGGGIEQFSVSAVNGFFARAAFCKCVQSFTDGVCAIFSVSMGFFSLASGRL